MAETTSGTQPSPERLHIGAVPGVNPGKWFRIWSERYPSRPIALTVVEEGRQRQVLMSGEVSLCFVRELDEDPELHQIPLYEEIPVVLVAKDHVLSVWDEVDVDDLRDLEFVQRPEEVHGWQGPMTTSVGEALLDTDVPGRIRLVARDLGVMVLPMAVARLHGRKDVVAVPVAGLPPTRVGLAWLRSLAPEVTEDFIGVVRGRTANTTRGSAPTPGNRTQAGKRRGTQDAGRRDGGRSRRGTTPGGRRRTRRRR